MDLATLSASIVSSFLVPYATLGLKKAGEQIVKSVGEAGAKRVIDLAENVWHKVCGIFASDKEKTALELFTEDPETMSPKIQKILVSKLEQHPALAADLQKLLAEDTAHGASSGAQILQAAVAGIVDLRNANISGSGNTFVGTNVGGIKSGEENGGSK